MDLLWLRNLYDTLIEDKINNEFNIEPEDFALGAFKYHL